jgi:hypothetical protein
MKNLKDKLTNIVALALLIAGSLDTYLKSIEGTEINWFQLVFYVGGALVAYFTGKGMDGKAKKI